MQSNRMLMIILWALLLLCLAPAFAHAAVTISAVRVWPGPEYTRITIESPKPIEYSLFMAKNPERVVLDLEDVELKGHLQSLPGRIGVDDPFITQARLGINRPGVVRLVLEVRSEVRPQAFALKPVGDYSNRLVVDIYPAHPTDPLMALIEQLHKDSPVSPSPAEPLPPNEAPTVTPAFPDIAADADQASVGTPTAPRSEPEKSAAKKSRPHKGEREQIVRLTTIAIDAGHGGEDPGARGRNGSTEKTITLAIARKLKNLIDGEPNMRAVLTRDGDYFVPLQDRVYKARKVRADLFVSIHADAYIKPHARGSSVFALSQRGATSVAARWLAKKENEADLIGGVNLDVPDPYVKQVLLDLSQTATITDSIKLGRAVLDEIGDINSLHKARVEQAGFAVLKAPDIPSILVETAFISNPQEEKQLRKPEYQEKLANAVLRGIRTYFNRNPPSVRERLALNP